MEIRPLGNTGIDVSRLCFGTGTSGWAGASNQTRLGMDAFVELLLYGYGKGILFWDLADQYGSHANAAKGPEAGRSQERCPDHEDHREQ